MLRSIRNSIDIIHGAHTQKQARSTASSSDLSQLSPMFVDVVDDVLIDELAVVVVVVVVEIGNGLRSSNSCDVCFS